MVNFSTRSQRTGKALRRPTTASRSEDDQRVMRSKRWKRARGTQDRHVNAHARKADRTPSVSHEFPPEFIPAIKFMILSQTSTESRGPEEGGEGERSRAGRDIGMVVVSRQVSYILTIIRQTLYAVRVRLELKPTEKRMYRPRS